MLLALLCNPTSAQRPQGMLLSAAHLFGLLMHAVAAVLQGYYANDAATAGAFRAGEGWFDTGDLGWVAPREQLIHRSSPPVHVTSAQL